MVQQLPVFVDGGEDVGAMEWRSRHDSHVGISLRLYMLVEDIGCSSMKNLCNGLCPELHLDKLASLN